MKNLASNVQHHLGALVPAPPALTPMLDSRIEQLLARRPRLIGELLDQYGSPLHLLWPQIFSDNVARFRAALDGRQLRYELFYGAKANKSQAFIAAAAQAGTGVDVSSIHELNDALRAGVAPGRICATGPAKSTAFLAALIACGALISVDSVEEFGAIERCCAAPLATPVRVLLRHRPASAGNSRFGMGVAALSACIERLATLRAAIRLEGFHFHLGGYASAARAAALRDTLVFLDQARALGLAPHIIDIGGGLPVRYVDSDAYDEFLRRQSGRDYIHGRVPASFYPYGGRVGVAEWLDGLLDAPCRDALTIAAYLRSHQLTLAIEPGRSLVDQAAISLFRIVRVKALAGGVHAVFVEGSSFSACETWFDSEFLVDPILLPGAGAQAAAGAPARAFIAGHSCLDEDLITRRLIHFARCPRVGDVLVFANTAGYQMDLLENEFHRHPMPRRLVVHCDGAEQFVVSCDANEGGKQ